MRPGTSNIILTNISRIYKTEIIVRKTFFVAAVVELINLSSIFTNLGPVLVPGWKEKFTERKIVKVSVSVDGSVIWIVEENNSSSFIEIRDRDTPLSYGDVNFKDVSISMSGIWGIREDGAYFRANNGVQWVRVGFPSTDETYVGIVAGLFNVYLVTDNNRIYRREGVSFKRPEGKKWSFYAAGSDISEGKKPLGFMKLNQLANDSGTFCWYWYVFNLLFGYQPRLEKLLEDSSPEVHWEFAVFTQKEQYK